MSRVLWLTLAAACAHHDATPKTAAPCQVVTDAAEVPRCVGKLVTLRGVVTRTKIPTILGVDVDAAYELADKVAEATGTLEAYVVEAPTPGEPIAASRGPGTYYALRTGDGLAKAK